MPDTQSSAPVLREAHRRAGPKQLAFSLLRILVATSALLLVYFMFPLSENDHIAVGLSAVVVGLTVFGIIFVRQLRRIRKARYPLLRAAEAIVLIATLFIIIMASVATAFSAADQSSYSEDLSRLDALYFSVTTLATVGYGDITPTSGTTRAFTTVQILLGVVLLGVGLRSLFSVAQRVNEDRERAEG